MRPSWSASLDAWSAASDHSLCFVFVLLSFLGGDAQSVSAAAMARVGGGGEIGNSADVLIIGQRTCYRQVIR